MKLIELIGEDINTEDKNVAIAMLTLHDLKELKNIVDHSGNDWPIAHEQVIDNTISAAENKTKSDDHLMTAWGFVEMFYPDYHSSNEIARNEDLTKIINGESEHGDDSDTMFKGEFGSDIGAVGIAYDQSNAEIYRKAIEGFINSTT